ncbi:MAG: hypothetical protein UFG06_02220 [Lachnospiraceae bacterium]|nr:hypothetical protein [Lachnospiraceae bacterium]
MLHVILQILAVIGIILLCILGLLLLLILLVLFVPVRYRVSGVKDGDVISLAVKVTYLLHILSVRYDYKEPGNIIVKLFGIRIFDSGKQADESREEQKETSTGQQTAEEAAKQSGKQTETAEQSGKTAEEATGQPSPTAAEFGPNEKTKDAAGQDADRLKEEAASGVQAEETQGKFQKIKYTIRNICDKIKNIVQKLKSIAENISYYRDVLTDIENERLLKRVKLRVFKVLKSIRPRVLKADLLIGTGSPDTTGYLCALYGMLLPVFGNNVNITADFEKAVWEGSVYAKGKITVFTILLQAGKIFFDKQLRIFIRQLKREEV